MEAADLKHPLPEPPFDPLTRTFMTWARSQPQLEAVRQGDRSWSYRDLEISSRRIADFLVNIRLKPSEVVAVTGERCYGLIAAMMGVLRSRGVLLSIDQALPVERRTWKLGEAKTRHLLHCGDAASPTAIGGPTIRVTRISDDADIQIDDDGREYESEPWLPVPGPNDPAYIFFTSGTTGTPKGILGGHKGLAHFLAWERDEFKVGPGDRVAQLTGLSFDVVLRDVFLPLVSGATLCLPDKGLYSYEASVIPWMERQRISVLHLVPSVAQTWLAAQMSPPRLDSLRLSLFAGEPLNDELVRRWRAALNERAQIVNLYGPTETTLAKCFYRIPSDPLPGVQPIGAPLPSTQVVILDDDVPCPPGKAGEIVIRTPFRTLGYLGSPPSSRKSFVVNPHRNDAADLLYHTGDLGLFDEQGILRIAGRLDDQVKINGVRIEPAEIASVLSTHPDVQTCIVLAREESPGTKRLVAYLVVKRPTPSQFEFRDFLKKKLPVFMIPTSFAFVESFPLTPNGKIDRRALASTESKTQLKPQFDEPPPNDAEKALLGIFRELLKSDRVGIHDSFFDLGGNSLIAARIVARVRQSMGIELLLDTFLREPTVARIAAQIERSGHPTDEPVIPLQPNGTGSPVFLLTGVDGHLISLKYLASQFGQDRRVLGLQPRGSDGVLPPYDSIPQVASYLVQAVQRLCPAGPYFLAGYCAGGMIAFEMAHQLRHAGRDVGVLALIETYGPGYPPLAPLSKRLRLHALRIARLDRRKQNEYLGERIHSVLARLKGRPSGPWAADPTSNDPNIHPKESRYVSATRIALKNYKPRPFQGRIDVFRGTDLPQWLGSDFSDPTLGWGRLSNDVSVHDVPGTHLQIIRPGSAEILSARLMDCILRYELDLRMKDTKPDSDRDSKSS